jgi:hypothetical protein
MTFTTSSEQAPDGVVWPHLPYPLRAGPGNTTYSYRKSPVIIDLLSLKPPHTTCI